MIEGIKITKLKKFLLDQGSVFHGMKKDDQGFEGFGEVYFSFIKKNAIKAWKLHKDMTMNLVVPVGEIKFNFYDLRKDSSTFNQNFQITVSEKNYSRITVPPNIWFGFKGLGSYTNLLVNIANIPHNSDEIETKELREIEFL